MNKAWWVVAWLFSVLTFTACATNDSETNGTGGGSSSSSATTSAESSASSGGSVDAGADSGDSGATVCGDGKLAAAELCDDGNAEDGDGCSEKCTVEKGYTCSGEPSKCSPVCGDGLLKGEEECDDGNTKLGDGCGAKCAVEDGWKCDTASPTVCGSVCGDGFITGKEECDDANLLKEDGCNEACLVEPGYLCVGAPSHCNAQCGDGIRTKGETCDDDNHLSGDGCSSECKIEEFWTCTDKPGAPSECITPCGDGHRVGKETCDDGNKVSGDGCNAACNAEFGWTCNGEPSACLTTCGDSKVAGAEKCDDGNKTGNDGCSVNCKIEPGWSCTQKAPDAASVCATACGDGFPIGTEQCDDGNKIDGDGCSATCQSEAGWLCAGIPSTCVTNCGDGLIAGDEQCDDRNTNNNDGCTSECKLQPGWACTQDPELGTVCEAICGDGLVVGTETCDDANLQDGDCCSSTCGAELACEIEQNDNFSIANDFSAINVGGIVKGTISPVGDVDFYLVSVPPVTTVALTAETKDGVNNACVANGQDSTVTVYDSDGATQLGTDDNSGPGNCALLTVTRMNGGFSGKNFYVEVKSSIATKTFDYSLKLSTQVTVCGNGIKEPGEQCDDSNSVSGDGCDDTCLYETVAEIEPNNTSTAALMNGAYPLNFLWSGNINASSDTDFYRVDLTATSDLTVETFDSTGPTNCAVIDTKIEFRASNGTTILASDSDDGQGFCALVNAASDTGMRHLAPGTYYVVITNQGFLPTFPVVYTAVVTPTAVCGNGIKEGFEQCDGTSNCDPNCNLLPVCGDGVIQTNEQCDDGNTANGDGCSATCLLEVTAEIEPNNTTAQADANPVISSDTLIAAAIGTSGDKDFFKVNVSTLSVVHFETFEGTSFNCPTIATTLRLFSGTGTQLVTDTTTGIGSCSALTERLAPGTYYISAEKTSTGTIPAYLLAIKFETNLGNEVEPNETTAQATSLPGKDVYVFGNHQVAADIDFYAITVGSGQSVRAEIIEGDTSETCESNGIDSFLTLFTSAGISLASDDDAGRGFCSLIDGTGSSPVVPAAHNLAAGTYYLQVKQSSLASGANALFNYDLVVTLR